MKDSNILDIPKLHFEIEAKSKEIGFTMPSDLFIGTSNWCSFATSTKLQ